MPSKIERETVIELLKSLPDNGLLSIGMSVRPLSRDDLIKHIRENDSVGEKVVNIYMNYLRSLKK